MGKCELCGRATSRPLLYKDEVFGDLLMCRYCFFLHTGRRVEKEEERQPKEEVPRLSLLELCNLEIEKLCNKFCQKPNPTSTCPPCQVLNLAASVDLYAKNGWQIPESHLWRLRELGKR